MKEKLQSDLVIIGGGLTGLATAYFLRNSGLSIHILEARERLGGRIHTLKSLNMAPQEMGATWLGQKHKALFDLLRELELGVFEQILGERAIYEPISTSPPQLALLPASQDTEQGPTYRIQGGSASIIEALAGRLNPDQCRLFTQQIVASIKIGEEGMIVETPEYLFKTKYVVSTLPPYLLLKTVRVSPDLPENLQEIMRHTHTWMGESIKISLAYEHPFWRTENLSATIFSSVGPVSEMYEHADVGEERFALKGFMDGTYFSLSKEERKVLVLNQLRNYYGSQADDFLAYNETVWRKEAFTFAPYESHVLPHQNNGHARYQQPYGQGRLFIAGSETARRFPGYMEGAVRSAAFVADAILNKKFTSYEHESRD